MQTDHDKGMPLVNALVLGNICEYRRKSRSAENYRFFGLHFSGTKFGFIFNHLT